MLAHSELFPGFLCLWSKVFLKRTTSWQLQRAGGCRAALQSPATNYLSVDSEGGEYEKGC